MIPRKLLTYQASTLYGCVKDEPMLAAMVAKTAEGAEAILATVTKDMPLYTLHDRTHILNVIAWMEALLGEQGVAQMSPVECALALMAAYVHDLGMTLGKAEAEALPHDLDYRKFRDGFLDLRLEIESLTRRGDTHRAEKLEEHLRVEFLRRTHAADARVGRMRARLAAILPNANDLNYKGVDLRDKLIQTAVSHNQPVRWLREQCQGNTPGVDQQELHHLWVGVLLRLADILDFDRSRTPAILFHHLGLEDDFASEFEQRSQEEWRKHLAITNIKWSAKSDRLTYEATDCFHPAVEKSVRHFVRQIQEELAACHEEIRQWPAFSRALRLSTVADPKITQKGYVYQDWTFQLDQQEIIQLLMGESLYGNPSLCIRELLQNALDAVELRDLRLQLQEKGGKPAMPVDGFSLTPGSFKVAGRPEQPFEVRLSWGEKDGRQFITVADNGVGMTEDAISRYFTRIGKSFYRSPEFRAEQEELRRHGLLATPISKFGIGVLSCFMIADRVTVKTHAGGNQALDLEISGPGSLFWTRQGTRTEQGTEITLWLKPELLGKPVRLVHDREDCWERLRLLFDYGTAEPIERTDDLDPALVAGEHVVWPKYPLQILPPVGEPWTLDHRFHIDHLAPIKVESLREKIAEREYPADCIDAPRWGLHDWIDVETGTRVRFWFPEDPGMRIRAWELDALVEAQLPIQRERPLMLVQSMRVEDMKELDHRIAIAPGVGWRIWIDYRGQAAPTLTADRSQVRPLPAELPAERALWSRLARQLAETGDAKWLGNRWRPEQRTLLAQAMSITPGGSLPLSGRVAALREDLTLDIRRTHSSGVARDLDGARKLELARDHARDLDDDYDRAREIDRAVACTLAVELAFNPFEKILMLFRGSPLPPVSLQQSILLRTSELQEGYGPSLDRSWHALNVHGNTGRIGDACLTCPAAFAFDLKGQAVQFAEPAGANPPQLAAYGYDLCFPMTAIPLGRLRREFPLWREDRRYRPLGVLPFLLPDLAEFWQRHRAELLERFPIGEIYALQPDLDLWYTPFAEWTARHWQRNTHRSLLWDIRQGQVISSAGIHHRDYLTKIGQPFTAFGDEVTGP
ncbi:MAG: ATP-binding protein [Bryobacteraceae bacterium]|nr:ATP-binding protein [Bryobacteraceae bacterium]